MDHAETWRPAASRQALQCRARLLADIRSFFSERKVMEVETPTLSRAGNSDPNIRNLVVEGVPPRFLRTSPEYAMKRLLAAGARDIYELGRVYRAGESGAFHNPEFTLLEWYRRGWKYLDLANEVVQLIVHCAPRRFAGRDVTITTYAELFDLHLGIDAFHCDEAELAAHAAERGIVAASLDRLEWLDLLLAELIQPQLEAESFTIVHEYPPEQAALARIRRTGQEVAERFEVYAGAVELANGYQELTDAVEQQQRFEHERRLQHVRGEAAPPLDDHLLAAMRQGLPDCAGVALGVDRLLMLILQVDHIDMVLSFPSGRA